MPSLSIVIPAITGVEVLETTLVSVLQNRPRDCEIVVVVNQPYADPYELKGEVRFIEAPAKARLVDCINVGLSDSKAPIVHVLAAGCEVEENWTQAANVHFRDPRVASVAPCVLDVTNRQRLIAAGVEYSCGGKRSLCTRMPKNKDVRLGEGVLAACSWAAFYRRSALARVGGGLCALVGDRFADVDLGLAFQQAGLRSVVAADSRVYASGEPLPPSSSFHAGLHAERLFWRNLPTRSVWKSLALHPFTAAAQTLLSLSTLGLPAHMAGRLIAACQIGQHRSHHAFLTGLRSGDVPENTKGRPHLRVDRPHISNPSYDAQPTRARAG